MIFKMIFVYMMVQITDLIKPEHAIIYWTIKGLLTSVDSQMSIKFTLTSKSF